MKIIAFLIAAAITSIALAETTDPQQKAAMQRMNYCGNLGEVYSAAAHARDLGYSPEYALNATRPYKMIPLEAQKKAINQVYFNRDFARAGGRPLSYQVYDLCLNGPKNYKPLK